MFEKIDLPVRHPIIAIGAFSFYWIPISCCDKHQFRCYILSWHTRRRVIHLSHLDWWVPIKMFPLAMIGSMIVSWRSGGVANR